MATTLNKGDMAIIQYSSDGGPLSLTGDGFTFVLLKDVDATTSINFTDAGYNSAGVLINDTITFEGAITWTSGAALSAGTTVRIFDNVTGDSSNAYQTATVGSITATSGAINGFASSGDQITAYQGPVVNTGGTPNLLFGASFADDHATNPLLPNGWNTNAPQFNGTTFDNSESALPTSLVGFEVGFNPEVDNAYYNGPQSGTPASVLAAIMNEANWVTSNSFQGVGVNGLDLPVNYNFSVSAPSNPPTLDVNNGSSLNEGGLDVITTAELETNDTDTADSALVYTLDIATANGDLWVDVDNSGTINGGEAAIGVGGTFTQQNIVSGQLKYQHDGTETTTDSFQFDVSDGPNSINNQPFNFTINALNDLPVVSNVDGDVRTFLSVLPNPVNLDDGGNVSISDPDHPILSAGSLTVSLGGTALAEDTLSIANVGLIGAGGGFVTFNSNIIGTHPTSGAGSGEDGNDLVVSLTGASATIAAVEALVAALRYGNDNSASMNPTARTATVVLNDGTSNSNVSSVTINIVPQNQTVDGADMVDDVLEGGAGNDIINGLSGNDLLTGHFGDDALNGGDGDDTASFSTDTSGININLNSGAAQVAGDLGMDTLSSIENLIGGSGNDRMVGTGTAAGANTLEGNDGNDILIGLGGDDTLNGGGGNDSMQGGRGMDTMSGGSGDDVMLGGEHDDMLTGGVGRDVLTGGAGNDAFIFTDTADSGLFYADRDIIRDFTIGEDTISLSGIDADTSTGIDDAFTFLGVLAVGGFTGAAGEIFAVNTAGGQTVVWADVNGDSIQDMTFVLDGTLALTSTDFDL